MRHAMMAVTRDRPGGEICTLDELRARVEALHPGSESRDLAQVGAVLPSLIRDLHTSIAAGRDVADLLDLAVLLHAQDTCGWLWIHSSSLDLRWQAASLAQQAAQERGTPTALGIAAWGAVVDGGGACALFVLRNGDQIELLPHAADSWAVTAHGPAPGPASTDSRLLAPVPAAP